MARLGTTFEFASGGRASGVLIVPLIAKPAPPLELVSRADAVCGEAISEILAASALGDDVGALAHSTRPSGFRRVLAVGLGDGKTLRPDQVRSAAGAAARWLVGEKLSSATLWLDGLAASGIDDAAGEWALGMALAGYRFEAFRSPPDKAPPAKVKVSVRSHEAAHAKRALPAMKSAQQLADGVNYTRQLAQQPGNVIQPKSLAAEARKLATQLKLKCTVLEGAKLKQMKMGGLIAVGQGAEHPSRLIRLDYSGAPGKRQRTALVGKAITFDTGGYSIKPSQGLANLKYDKTGGCTVMGIIKAAAQLKLKCNLTGLVAAAENMVSDRAYRAGDIITMANGKTVEVTNTDAEGRLVLADALWYAEKHCKATTVIDLATLTGGVGVSLGSVAAGLMTNDESLASELEECGRVTHERLWQLPLWEDYVELMRGNDSDLVNSSSKRDAHCIQGGIFLRQFITDATPWAHLDIAAVAADESGPRKQATGFGVRLVVEYLRRHAV